MMTRKKVTLWVSALSLAMAAGASNGQSNFPSDDISFFVPATAGGGSDYLVRSLQPSLEETFDVSIVPQYVPGGGGAIGFMRALQARPDGQSVVAIDNKVFTQQGLGNVNFEYEDFDYLAQMYSVPYVLALNSDLGFDTLEEALESGDNLKIAFAGVGSSTHIMSVLVGSEMDANFEYVAYSGAPDAIAAVMGGHIDGMVMDPTDLKGPLESGAVTPLVQTSAERSGALPDVPTMKEKGFDVTVSNWRGIAAPAGLDEETKQQWVEALRIASEDPRFINAVNNIGLEVDFMAGPEFDEYVDSLADTIIPAAQQVAEMNR
ncbi:Bug family tripartite tricarboxylate transporter substrate binding protein [Halomonas sp. GD1P12]|uniref:Bug family tripartite tricarboxylate transporter substrate binding protein n=1 Tax=Halomonas sp. GD1P12 TaxID=2982691 RepID=UPI0021E4A273|nr:tripartite tricarboxylate transporter substrate binding protein [Halomonas sp. GD1P12]UYF99598.1 tripartite tricarboxylate transporter substrate binding protein [Halomonas sp. GD1P12]